MLITQVGKQAGRWSHEPNSHGRLAAHATHAHKSVMGGDSHRSEPPPTRSSHCCLLKAHFPSADTVCLDPLKVTEGVLSKLPRIWGSFFLFSSPAFPKHQWEKEISVRIGNRKELWSPGLGEGKIWNNVLKLFEIIKEWDSGSCVSFFFQSIYLQWKCWDSALKRNEVTRCKVYSVRALQYNIGIFKVSYNNFLDWKNVVRIFM